MDGLLIHPYDIGILLLCHTDKLETHRLNMVILFLSNTNDLISHRMYRKTTVYLFDAMTLHECHRVSIQGQLDYL